MKQKQQEKAKRVDLAVELLRPHPLNREFKTTGEAWDEFCESIREHGVLEELLVRPLDGGYEVLSGHRRMAAAKVVGKTTVPARVEVKDDREALETIVNLNLQREDPTLVDEARLVRAMIEDFGMTPEEVSKRLSRPLHWIEGRQLVFLFPYEVIEALRDDDRSRRLSEGAFMQIVSAPPELREKAMQMVLFPAYQHEPLSEWMAHDLIHDELIPEWEAERKWEAEADDLRKKTVAKLRKVCLAKKPDVHVIVQGWARDGRGIFSSRPAVGRVDELLTEDAPEGLKWIDLAERMSAPVYIVPPNGEVVVSAKMIHDFEDSLAEWWKKKESGQPVDGDASTMMRPWLKRDAGKAAPDKKVEAAVSVLDGEGEADYDDSPEKSRVASPDGEDGIKIEQTMQHHAMIDMGTVKKLAMWAVSSTADPNTAPEWVPQWAKAAAYEGNWTLIDHVCNWVISLKGK